MAKAGFWLRGAKGKLAGASMGKGADGQTIMREIVTPKNPRTPAQLYQRAIMATVMRAYGAGKEIFDHSFEGKSVGSQNQREFLSRNARILRALIAGEVNSLVPVEDQLGRVIGPGTRTPVGFEGLVISDGSYPLQAFNISPVTAENEYLSIQLPTALENETRAQYAQRVGLVSGDFYTFVGYAYGDDASIVFEVNNSERPYGAQVESAFFFVRLGVKDAFINSTEAMTGVKLSDIFYEDTYTREITISDLLDNNYNSGISVESLFEGTGFTYRGWMGLIRSRKDVDLRSKAVLYSSQSGLNGIASQYALAAWQQGTASLGDSELILEGGGF